MEIALIESPDIKEKRLGRILRISKSKVNILSPTLSPPKKLGWRQPKNMYKNTIYIYNIRVGGFNPFEKY